MLNLSQINQWLLCVEPYRNKLDLATIIWYCMRVQNTNDWEPIRDDIFSVAGDLVDDSFRDFKFSRIRGGREIAFQNFENSVEETPDEKWFCKYRETLSAVTPFSDEEVYDDDEISKLGDEWQPSEYFCHPVLSNRDLVNSFVDLDAFIDRMKDSHRRIPEELLSEKFVDVAGNEGFSYHPTEEISVENPFLLYGLIPEVKEFLWSGNIKAGEALKRLAKDYTSSEFKYLLGAVFNVSPTHANILRIYTQPTVQRMQGSSGRDLSQILEPLMKVMLFDEDTSENFWLLRKSDYKELEKLLGITESERAVLMALAKPRAHIDLEGGATFVNPGKTKFSVMAARARELCEYHLPILRSKFSEPAKREYYEKLRTFLK